MAIDYNGDILPFYASRLEVKDEYIQEEASQVGNVYPADEVRGAQNEQISINGVNTTAMAPVAPVIADWLAAIQALPLHGTDFVASMFEGAIMVEAIGGINLVIADGTAAGGLAATGLTAGTTVGGGDLETGRADQQNEQRILTTLGVLVAHLRLMGDRDEARNLHFVMSRIATGVGSGGFVYRDQTAEVTGNRQNPAFVSGDEIHIELQNEGEGSVVTPPVAVDVSTAGVTLAVLVGEINAASPAADDLTASDAGGYLKLESENGLTITLVQGGTNDTATKTAGLEFESNLSKRNEVANKVKDEALDYFDTNRRDLNL